MAAEISSTPLRIGRTYSTMVVPLTEIPLHLLTLGALKPVNVGSTKLVLNHLRKRMTVDPTHNVVLDHGPLRLLNLLRQVVDAGLQSG